jgi:spermidine synthase
VCSSDLIVDVATDPGYFTFLESCTPDAKIVLGDARLTLAEASDGVYDLIIVDAFSSDAIPGSEKAVYNIINSIYAWLRMDV